MTLTFAYIFMAIGHLIVSFMLVQGCRTRNHQLTKPWLIWNYISLGLVAVGTVIGFFVMAFNQLLVPGLIVLVVVALLLLIVYYFIHVVERFVAELKAAWIPIPIFPVLAFDVLLIWNKVLCVWNSCYAYGTLSFSLCINICKFLKCFMLN